MHNVKVKNFSVGKGEKLCIIAGPCLLEGYDLGMRVAETTAVRRAMIAVSASTRD